MVASVRGLVLSAAIQNLNRKGLLLFCYQHAYVGGNHDKGLGSCARRRISFHQANLHAPLRRAAA